MHATSLEPNIRPREQDPNQVVTIQTTSALSACVYTYLGFQVQRVETFGGNLKVEFILTRLERDQVSNLLANPDTVLQLHSFVDRIRDLDVLIERAQSQGGAYQRLKEQP